MYRLRLLALENNGAPPKHAHSAGAVYPVADTSDRYRLRLGSSVWFGGLQAMFPAAQAQGPRAASPIQSEALVIPPLPRGDYEHEHGHEEGSW